MYEIDNVLRDYAWGSTTAIAALLGRPESGAPEAELWIGAHPDSPSTAHVPEDGSTTPLDALITSDPEHFLGAESVARFGPRLPFLAKILAAAQPLSLQVHPSLQQAQAGFARENADGVAPDAPHRNYRDDNHKPEMILALTPFEALCGFRSAAATRGILQHVADAVSRDTGSSGDSRREGAALLAALLEDLDGGAHGGDEGTGLRRAFERLITGGENVATATSQVVAALIGDSLAPYEAELGTVVSLNEKYPGDPGVLISLLLNRLSLQPGEAVYLPAGNVHAYLHGLGVEVMASSDNVLRGGLTPKYVDVPELLRTIDFSPVAVPMLETERSELDQELFRPPFAEFQLQRIELSPGDGPVPLAQSGAAVVIVVAGGIYLDSPKGDLRLDRGASAFLAAAEAPVNVHLASGGAESALAFAVTTGL
ncbi:mannose-6-phosphate isomerase, class I [Pseudarthrobacter chlorophenolicus A6]|uniref:mannose-6-phosphate isomerase n=1 Tax=Pseudarthrobacter chlorophenolicus (strain ATCC 700700 / DSM 12829 / CIP 107037 / JCM 12360 / KCTC 9906 / NCIMB 13794 / A6) TaxID=452863 RepID=B8HEY2_PSECP|nr:mannose-6-phosphate isomerase, class I [Pseudarthrobacter chlorophenolicus]ACL39248.1 mannose-6-phosphate isomerase, class I [Pseudarthrobacter chlorophenolicus A6]SDR02231.1 mannose-6-phosphate isomerase, type 1 [Pseudarthrobacter chlorophenolicus]